MSSKKLTFLDAMLNKSFWTGSMMIRPIGRWGKGVAISREDIECDPDQKMNIRDVLADWELVDPETVRKEMNA